MKKCANCQRWQVTSNGGVCKYIPPPIIVRMGNMLQSEPAMRIDWAMAADEAIITPSNHYCDEYRQRAPE